LGRRLLAPANGDLMARFETTTVLLRPAPEWTRDLWDEVVRIAKRADGAPRRALWWRSATWLIPAAVTGAVATVGLGRPGLWTDELATWGMATAPWSQFWPVLRYVDAVLAPYYAFMHMWIWVFGSSDIALRAPSLLAMMGSAAIIGALGRRLFGRSQGIVGGIVFAVLPSTSRFAAEARPFALTAFVACVATWLLLRASQRPSRARWFWYGLSVVVLGWLHVVALLLLAAHALTMMSWRRDAWARFAIAAAVACVASVPLLIFGVFQRNQVAYIPRVGLDTSVQYGQVLFGGVAIGIVVVVLALFSLPLRFPAAVLTSWAIVPPAALVVVSLALPMFLARYLVFTTPAWALLVGVALVRWRIGLACLGIVVLAALGLPAQLQQRTPGGHGQATRQIAEVLRAQEQPGDAIVYADDEPGGSWTLRDAVARYVPADVLPHDALAVTSPRHAGKLLATECPDPQLCLNDAERVWVVRLGTLDDPLTGVGTDKEDLLRQDYQVTRIWYPAGITMALLQRSEP
jgi:mannosyltransferase